MSHLLIIDDDEASCRMLQLHFQDMGHSVALAHNIEEGLANAADKIPQLIVLDIQMPGISGLEGLPRFKELAPEVPVIMITAHHDMDSTIEAMKQGADDYIHKPIDIDEIDQAVNKALDRAMGADDAISLDDRRAAAGASGGSMVGGSRAMLEVFKTIGLVAPKPVTVLIGGESGTGKELAARAIHAAGSNSDGSFIPVNCAALMETLLESDLFGHERGAFTGAVERHAGKFAMAENGTIFLDEVGDLSASVQAKLLRVLQEKEYVPVGGRRVKTANARVIAATNVDLAEKVAAGEFREDLFYRLQVVTLHLPPLRERREDIPGLVQALLGKIKRGMQHKVTRLNRDVIEAFQVYDWPGNVRELENTLMKMVVLVPGDTITLDLVPDVIAGDRNRIDNAQPPLEEMSLEQANKVHVEKVLAATNWHRGRACEILGISRPRLRRLINQYGLAEPVGSE
ncbi:MAG: sigma-54 dependent transcriptional regulator [Pseudomonadota bacterium]|nr:sigma-54 dependent transcriptional regulator [Pseudomonadota bacterium]